MTSPARAGAAATGPPGPDRTAALAAQLAAVEASIRDDRHRQPPAVDEIEERTQGRAVDAAGASLRVDAQEILDGARHTESSRPAPYEEIGRGGKVKAGLLRYVR